MSVPKIYDIVLVDDDPVTLDMMCRLLSSSSYQLRIAANGEQALYLLREKSADLVVTDICMPGMGGLALLKHVKAMDPCTQVIIFTGHGTMELAIQALKDNQAFDFLAKPKDARKLQTSVAKALEHGELLRENDRLTEQLRHSEQRYRSFVESLKSIAYQLKPDGKPIFYQGAVMDISGYSISALCNQNPDWLALIHPEDRERVCEHRKSVQTETRQNAEIEYRIQHREGQWRWLNEHTQSMMEYQGGVAGIQGIIFDITARKEIQSQMAESRKLEAIATLAGGLAHKYNNALAGLTGYLELLQIEHTDNHCSDTYTEPIMELVQHMAGLTEQLLAYAKGGKYAPKFVSLSDFIQEMLPLIKHRISRDTILETDFSSNAHWVKADTTQLQMVILALIQNAIEAIKTSGKISINMHDAAISTHPGGTQERQKPGAYIRLCVSDNGCGMDDQTRKKIFDPFFTTKFIGRGLGLSAVFGIVRNHHGWIEVDSTPNQGTDVCIYLPVVEPPAAPVEQSKEPSQASRDATVLVIEDEAPLRKVIRRLLTRLNYTVLEAESGREAMEIVRNHPDPIHVVLLDMILPDADGKRLYHELRSVQPDLPIILCSGYAVDEPVKDLLENGARGFLQKPFSTKDLAARIKSVVDP
jgi:two-component system cell cycle sensor histidine kinase/response regulator CckA